MTERNRELFHLVADAIEQNPDRHSQRTWMQTGVGYTPTIDQLTTAIVNGEVIEECGTSQCVAGWVWTLEGNGRELADVINDGFKGTPYIMGPAACALGISDQEAEVLFVNSYAYTEDYNWPNLLRDLGDGKDMQQAFTDNIVADDPEELMPEASFYPLSREPTYYSHPTATTNP